MKRAKMTSITITFMMSVYAIVMEHTPTNRQTRKDYFTTKCIFVAAIFEDFVSGVIPEAVDKINKMAESGSPRLGVNEVWFFLIPSTIVAYKVNHYLWTKNEPVCHARNKNRCNGSGDPHHFICLQIQAL